MADYLAASTGKCKSVTQGIEKFDFIIILKSLVETVNPIVA